MKRLSNKKWSMSIRTFGVIMIAVTFIMTAFTHYSIHDVKVASETAQQMSDIYIDGQVSLVNMKISSDAMIERVRSFVMTGNTVYLDDYINNLSDAEQREKTLVDIIDKLGGSETHEQISKAMENIEEMIDIEMHSLRLALSGYRIDDGRYASELELPKLTSEEEKMDDEQKISLARELLYNEDYQMVRNEFTGNVEYCIDQLTDYTLMHRDDSFAQIKVSQNTQRLIVTGSLLLVVLEVIAFWVFIGKPISKNTEHIEKGEFLDVRGLKDIQIMSEAYNRMFDRIEKDKEKLSYEASHDSLTGLLNRNAYNIKLRELDHKDFCFILLDVDDFKGFNDTYGHDVGDMVLKKISRVLSANVRSQDMVFRLGGDEFAIVMTGIRKENSSIITNRMDKIREDLLIKDDDIVPQIRISLGATYSSGELDLDRTYKEADVALYQAKIEKNKLVFYEDAI